MQNASRGIYTRAQRDDIISVKLLYVKLREEYGVSWRDTHGVSLNFHDLKFSERFFGQFGRNRFRSREKEFSFSRQLIPSRPRHFRQGKINSTLKFREPPVGQVNAVSPETPCMQFVCIAFLFFFSFFFVL